MEFDDDRLIRDDNDVEIALLENTIVLEDTLEMAHLLESIECKADIAIVSEHSEQNENNYNSISPGNYFNRRSLLHLQTPPVGNYISPLSHRRVILDRSPSPVRSPFLN